MKLGKMLFLAFSLILAVSSAAVAADFDWVRISISGLKPTRRGSGAACGSFQNRRR
jgi:hypothetical protein